MRYFVLMWPGFARAWWRGEIYGVALAILFAVCLNLAWTATYIWPELLPSLFVTALWTGVFVAAVYSLVANVSRWQVLFGEPAASPNRKQADDSFRSAQKSYLRGEYFEAEAALHPIFSAGREDAESALLLAAILRRTNRIEQAIQTLERLSRLDCAAGWYEEIHRERSLCIRDRKSDQASATEAVA